MNNEHYEKLKQVTDRIRYLREALDLSAAEAGAKLGISADEYALFESGEKDISISMIYALSGIFGVDATELLTGQSPRMVDYTVSRKGQGIDVKRYEGYSFEALAPNFIGRNKEPMLVSIKPSDKAPEPVRHGGQEFNYVVEGKIGVVIKDKTLVLEKGDSIYFNPRLPHGQFAIDGDALFLTVIDKE